MARVGNDLRQAAPLPAAADTKRALPLTVQPSWASLDAIDGASKGEHPVVLERDLVALIARGEWETLRGAIARAVSGPLHELAKRPMTGIGSERSVRFFADSVIALKRDWGRQSPQQRADRLLLAVNAELLRASIPAVTRIEVVDLAARAAMERRWSCSVNRALVDSPTIDNVRLLLVAATVFHEARHAEQFFRIARLMATLGWPAAEISRVLGLPSAIVEEAARQPLPPGDEHEEARVWMQAFVTDAPETEKIVAQVLQVVPALAGVRAQAQSALTTGRAMEHARAVLDASIRATEVAYIAYRAIPYEQDAKVAEIRAANAIADAMRA
ncbi:MAG: hypothetical protein ACAI38_19710 [Myxococcota bacterium]